MFLPCYLQGVKHFPAEQPTARARVERERARLLREFPQTRLLRHLVENCTERYGCPAARNFTLDRFECPLPTTPGRNAACVGCISEQPADWRSVARH